MVPKVVNARNRKLNFAGLLNEVDNTKLKTFFLKNDTAFDISLTNEIAERSLGKLDLMKQLRPKFSTSFEKLSLAEKWLFQNKVKQF